MYFELFKDSFIAGLFFYPLGKLAFPIMIKFYEHKVSVIFISSLASLLAQIINYFVGSLFYKSIKFEPSIEARYIKLQYIFSYISPILLGLSSIPFLGGFLGACSGFFKVSFLRIMIYSLANIIAYHIIIAYLIPLL